MTNGGVQVDFFISYTGADRTWAEWIAWRLEEGGYSTLLQAWDFRPGTNFVAQMDEASKCAERTLLVLSEDYLQSDYAFAEWAAAFRLDPKGQQGKVLPVRIQRCEVKGLLGPIDYIDLVDLDEQQAGEKLLKGVQRGRAKPSTVSFPGSSFPSGLLTERPAFPGSLPPIWNVPYPQNPLFLGREDLLVQLAAAVQSGQPTALSQSQAITGLGGVGKTQLALEYAYCHRGEYQAVLWVLADTRENFISSYLALARLLSLPEWEEQESDRVIMAVKQWLQRTSGWLLILDNADDLALAREFLPPAFGGYVLLTTRAQALGRFARRLEVDVLPTDLGALFLLRRAGVLTPEASLDQATQAIQSVTRAICEELGGLPLALDQAGAYIEETECGLPGYQQLYQQRRADLLAERRGLLVDDYPYSVATTWSLSFGNVKQESAAAADLLCLCAFLAPDAIPQTILTEGAEYLGPYLAPAAADAYCLNQAIGTLRAYSLLRREVGRESEPLLYVHRLVQAVLTDQMSEQEQHQWRERAVQAVSATFPDVEHQTWSQCERLLPHALLCARYIEQEQMASPDAALLLNRTGSYLQDRAQYSQAEPLLKRALAICEQMLGWHHPTARIVHANYASLLYDRSREAAVLIEQERSLVERSWLLWRSTGK